MYRTSVASLFVFMGVALVTPLSAQRTVLNPAGPFDGYDSILVNENVQKELKLSDEQVLKVNQAVHDIRQGHRAELEKLRALPPPQGSEKFRQLAKSYSDEALKKATGLLSPEQIKRLKQIKLQKNGIGAFCDPDVIKALALTDEQKAQIKTIEEDLAEKGKDVLKGGARGNFQEALARLAALSKAAVQKAVDRLSPAQNRTWKEMTGEPFDFRFEGPLDRRPRGSQK